MRYLCLNAILPVSRKWRAAVKGFVIAVLALALFAPHSGWSQSTSATLDIVHPNDGDTVRAGGKVQVVMVLKGGTLDGAFIGYPGAGPSDTHVSSHVIVATFPVPDLPGAQMAVGAKVLLSDGTFLFVNAVVNISD